MTITATSYGGFGQVEETLPQGFSYTGSNLSEDFVTEEEDGQTVSFVLLGDRSFTYTVEVSDLEDTYTFSGVLFRCTAGCKQRRQGDWRSFSRLGRP